MTSPDTSSPSARRPLLRRWRAAGLVAAVAGALALGACSHGGHRGWQDGPLQGSLPRAIYQPVTGDYRAGDPGPIRPARCRGKG